MKSKILESLSLGERAGPSEISLCAGVGDTAVELQALLGWGLDNEHFFFLVPCPSAAFQGK